MKVKKIFTSMKKKDSKNFIKYNLREWFEYFYHKKSKRLNVEFRKVFFDFKLKYAFLDESQVNGKVCDFLGIPNTCGNIDKKKFRKLVTLEKKSNKNRLDIHTLKIKKTKPVKATNKKFFTLKPSKILKVDEIDDNSPSNFWFDDILSVSSYQSPRLLKKSPEIEIRLSRFNDDQLPKKSTRYFSSISKWSSVKSPEIEEKLQNSPQIIETDEIKSSISPSFSSYRNQPIFDIKPPQSDKTTKAIETPNLSFSSLLNKLDIHENYKETDKTNIIHESDSSSSSINDHDTGIMSVEDDPGMYKLEDKSTKLPATFDTHIYENYIHKTNICHEFDKNSSSSSINDHDTGIMSVEDDSGMYKLEDKSNKLPATFDTHIHENYKHTDKTNICPDSDENTSSSSISDHDTGIMCVEDDPGMYTHEDKSTKLPATFDTHIHENYKHTDKTNICPDSDENASSSSINDHDTGIMSVEDDSGMYTHEDKSTKLPATFDTHIYENYIHKTNICHEFDNNTSSSSIINDHDTGIMSVEENPGMYTFEDKSTKLPTTFNIYENYKHDKSDIWHESDEYSGSISLNDYDTGIMSIDDPGKYTLEDKSHKFEQELEILSSSIEYDPANYMNLEDQNNSKSSDNDPCNILTSETDLEINLFSKNAPEDDDLLFAGHLLIDQNKKIITNKYMSSNKESLSKTMKHFENNINQDIEVVPKGIFGYLKNDNDELIIKPVSLREIMSVSDEKSVKYQDLLSSSDITSPTTFKTRMSESDISEYECSSLDDNWTTININDSDENISDSDKNIRGSDE